MGEDLTDNDVKDEDLRVYMKMNTYIKWFAIFYSFHGRKSVKIEGKIDWRKYKSLFISQFFPQLPDWWLTDWLTMAKDKLLEICILLNWLIELYLVYFRNDPWFWVKLKYALPHTEKKNLQCDQFAKLIQKEKAIKLDKMRTKMESQVAA
jgi:hypothetical protein